jgi:hypothetical protein
MVPVSAIATAQPVSTPSDRSSVARGSGCAGASSDHTTSPTRHQPGRSAGATMARASRARNDSSIRNGSADSRTRWTTAR